MSHAIDKTRMVKGVLVQKLLKVAGNLILVSPVPDFPLHLLEHLDNLDISAAVAGEPMAAAMTE